MKHYFLEAFSHEIKYEADSIIIALTPMIAYELDKAGINHTIIEDYYKEADLLNEEGHYYNEQLKWFKLFDRYLLEIFPDTKYQSLGLASSYYFYIKCMVDSIILRCKMIQAFLDKVKPDQIVYISNKWKEDDIQAAEYPMLFRKGQSLFSRLLPAFCKKHDIEYRHIILEGSIERDDSPATQGDIKTYIISSMLNSTTVEGIWHYFKTFSIKSLKSAFTSGNTDNYLFLNRHGIFRDIMKDAMGQGSGVYYMRGTDIVKQSIARNKVIDRIGTTAQRMSCNRSKHIDLDGINGIMKWINECCGIDVSIFLLQRFEYFIDEHCQKLLYLIDKYVSLYNNYSIQYVLTDHMVNVNDYAAVFATRYANNTKSICLQHGDDAFSLKMLDQGEYSPYHIYLSTNYEKEEYIESRKGIANIDTNVYQYPNRYIKLERNVKTSPINNIKTLVYVPTMYHWDNTIWNEARCPDTWYYSWHKILLHYFASINGINIVWKGIPGSNEITDPVPKMIKDNQFIIRYATEPFVNWINRADMILLDYPSTALYEAAVSGLPVMSLYYKPFHKVREGANILFGRSLQSYSSFDEGIEIISKYLDSNLNDYRVSIPYSKTPVLETLKRISMMHEESN